MTLDYCIVITAREGSTRCKDKMVRPFCKNMNLVEWKLQQLTTLIPRDRIYLSTNSKILKQSADKFGVQIHHRDDYYCNGFNASFPEVVYNITTFLPHEHIAWCPSTSPLMSVELYVDCLNQYNDRVVKNQTNDGLITVLKTQEYFWDDSGPVNNECSSDSFIRTQDLPSWYKITFGAIIRPKCDLLKDKFYIGKNPYLHNIGIIPSMDIDTEEEFIMCQSLISLIM